MDRKELRDMYMKETGDIFLIVVKYADWMEKKLTSDNKHYETTQSKIASSKSETSSDFS